MSAKLTWIGCETHTHMHTHIHICGNSPGCLTIQKCLAVSVIISMCAFAKRFMFAHVKNPLESVMC